MGKRQAASSRYLDRSLPGSGGLMGFGHDSAWMVTSARADDAESTEYVRPWPGGIG
ncbi:hypothetical protein ACFYQQ_01325 [Streptomyces sp. NPDC005496]|uniref:hypothetical protein n=1 Tax=unclassified Streptomyces TaxID=2593676 RepID=UPI0033AE1843